MKHYFLVRRLPLGRGFLAINLFGLIFSIRRLRASELRHELIHTRQQLEMLFLPFFVWYVVEWLVLCLRYRDRMKAYRNISFEREAYRNQDDEKYLEHRKMYAWTKEIKS